MSIIPKSKPQASRAHVIAAAKKQWKKDHTGEPLPAAFMVGIRSYYFRTMGNPNSGDRNIYDDCLAHAMSDPTGPGWVPVIAKI